MGSKLPNYLAHTPICAPATCSIVSALRPVQSRPTRRFTTTWFRQKNSTQLGGSSCTVSLCRGRHFGSTAVHSGPSERLRIARWSARFSQFSRGRRDASPQLGFVEKFPRSAALARAPFLTVLTAILTRHYAHASFCATVTGWPGGALRPVQWRPTRRFTTTWNR